MSTQAAINNPVQAKEFFEAKMAFTTGPVELERMMGNHEVNVVDVRAEEDYADGHIPGAVHLSKGIIERDIETQFPNKTAPLVLYCGGGFRSALAADSLKKMGYTSVISMDGGMRGWREAGYTEVV